MKFASLEANLAGGQSGPFSLSLSLSNMTEILLTGTQSIISLIDIPLVLYWNNHGSFPSVGGRNTSPVCYPCDDDLLCLKVGF